MEESLKNYQLVRALALTSPIMVQAEVRCYQTLKLKVKEHLEEAKRQLDFRADMLVEQYMEYHNDELFTKLSDLTDQNIIDEITNNTSDIEMDVEIPLYQQLLTVLFKIYKKYLSTKASHPIGDLLVKISRSYPDSKSQADEIVEEIQKDETVYIPPAMKEKAKDLGRVLGDMLNKAYFPSNREDLSDSAKEETDVVAVDPVSKIATLVSDMCKAYKNKDTTVTVTEAEVKPASTAEPRTSGWSQAADLFKSLGKAVSKKATEEEDSVLVDKVASVAKNLAGSNEKAKDVIDSIFVIIKNGVKPVESSTDEPEPQVDDVKLPLSETSPAEELITEVLTKTRRLFDDATQSLSLRDEEEDESSRLFAEALANVVDPSGKDSEEKVASYLRDLAALNATGELHRVTPVDFARKGDHTDIGSFVKTALDSRKPHQGCNNQ
jgi:hypothetical protein